MMDFVDYSPRAEPGLKKRVHDIGFYPEIETSLHYFGYFLLIFLVSCAMIRRSEGLFRFHVEA